MKTDDFKPSSDTEKSLDIKHDSGSAASVSPLDAANSRLRTSIMVFLDAYIGVLNGIWRMVQFLFNRRFWFLLGRLVILLVLITPFVFVIALLSAGVGYVVEALAGTTAGFVVGWVFGLSSLFFSIRTLHRLWARKKQNRSLSPSGAISGSTNDLISDTNHNDA